MSEPNTNHQLDSTGSLQLALELKTFLFLIPSTPFPSKLRHDILIIYYTKEDRYFPLLCLLISASMQMHRWWDEQVS